MLVFQMWDLFCEKDFLSVAQWKNERGCYSLYSINTTLPKVLNINEWSILF